MLGLLLFAKLQIARDLDDNLRGPAMLSDQGIDEFLQLPQAAMNGRIGDFAMLGLQFIVARCM